MTGPEHYEAAEGLLRQAVDLKDDDFTEYSLYQAAVALCLQEAQAHATLALDAATALHDPEGGTLGDQNHAAWRKAASA